MGENWEDQKRKESLHILLWVGLITLLLLLLSVAGTLRNEEPSADYTEAETAEAKVMAEPLQETSLAGIPLTSDDKEFLNRLTELFDRET